MIVSKELIVFFCSAAVTGGIDASFRGLPIGRQAILFGATSVTLKAIQKLAIQFFMNTATYYQWGKCTINTFGIALAFLAEGAALKTIYTMNLLARPIFATLVGSRVFNKCYHAFEVINNDWQVSVLA